MIGLYLKTKIVGASSKILYGNIGDVVYIIGRNADMILVVNNKGLKFHVKDDDLSRTPISKT